MGSIAKSRMRQALSWATSALGPIEVISDHSKAHGDRVSATTRIRSRKGLCYLKVHESRGPWQIEAHAYEHWTRAFGRHAPRLLGVRDREPLALIVSEVPGRIVEKTRLTRRAGRAIWKSAGKALRPFHDQAFGPGFGSCRRDGTLVGRVVRDPVACISGSLTHGLQRGLKGRYLSRDEAVTVRAVVNMAPAFKGERPVPCHMDYAPVNWLMNERRGWTGVVDFEFSAWHFWMSDFTRDPDWHWIKRPDLVDAFCEGYGRTLSPSRKLQLLVGHAAYALNAITWGRANRYFGFEKEGHASLAHLAKFVR